MTQHAMSRNCVGVRARALDQFTAAQEFERGLDGALREPGFFRERAQTRRNWFPFRARGAAVEVKINKIRGWLAIVADDIAHENIHDVIVNWNGFAKTNHGKSGGGLSVTETSPSCRVNTVRLRQRSKTFGDPLLLFLIGLAEEEFHCMIKALIHQDNRVIFLGRGRPARVT